MNSETSAASIHIDNRARRPMTITRGLQHNPRRSSPIPSLGAPQNVNRLSVNLNRQIAELRSRVSCRKQTPTKYSNRKNVKNATNHFRDEFVGDHLQELRRRGPLTNGLPRS